MTVTTSPETVTCPWAPPGRQGSPGSSPRGSGLSDSSCRYWAGTASPWYSCPACPGIPHSGTWRWIIIYHDSNSSSSSSSYIVTIITHHHCHHYHHHAFNHHHYNHHSLCLSSLSSPFIVIIVIMIIIHHCLHCHRPQNYLWRSWATSRSGLVSLDRSSSRAGLSLSIRGQLFLAFLVFLYPGMLLLVTWRMKLNHWGFLFLICNISTKATKWISL